MATPRTPPSRKASRQPYWAPISEGSRSTIESAEHRAADVGGGGPADLARGKAERVGTLERRRERAHDRDLEAVEQPAHAERDHHAPVPGGPRQAIQARRYGGLEHAAALTGARRLNSVPGT